MPDQTSLVDPPERVDEQTQSESTLVQLKYPTIDIQTSLESLLSTSTPIPSHPSTVMATGASSIPAMDESWASLDVSDFSHDDDDTQSENTDVGSLVDLSSVHDTESAVEDELQSEIGIDEERASGVLMRGISQPGEQAAQPENERPPIYETVEDTIILHQAATQSGEDYINLEYNKIRPTTSPRGACLRETIDMTVSRRDLTLPEDRPFWIYYYSTSSSRHHKDDLLGKIGAALVSPLSTTSSRTSLASTCFNIVPSEFGPGSKPTFADLIPSQAQMAVDELVLLESAHDSETHGTIRFSLQRGNILESKPTTSYPESRNEEYRPDLLVIQVSHEDADEGFLTINELASLAAHHFWPTIIVAEDTSVPPVYALTEHLGISVSKGLENPRDAQHDAVNSRFPIDLDSFMAIDTDQLSHHIEYIIDRKFTLEQENKAAAKQQNTFSNTMRSRFLLSKENGAVWYTLEAVEPEDKSTLKVETTNSRLNEAKQFWSTLDHRRHIKDLVFTLFVMMLGVYIFNFSQNMSSETILRKSADLTILTSVKTDSTATVTATLADISQPTTTVASISRDVVMYDPISFDQMWHRLTGRPIGEQEDTKASPEVVQESNSHNMNSAEDVEVMGGMARNLEGWLGAMPDKIKNLLPQKMLSKAAESAASFERHNHLQEMHQKLQDFYEDVSKNVPGMKEANKLYLRRLVHLSSQHLAQARLAGERGLEPIIADQKKILARAQSQAQRLVPAKKKRSFLGRG